MSRRPYVRAVSPTRWYLAQPRYLRYMSREVTCVFIGALAVLMLVALVRLAQGPDAWAAFLDALRSPGGIALLVLVLAFSVHNTTSWFNVTPKVMRVQLGEAFVPDRLIVAAHYVAWIAVTLAVAWLAGVAD